MTIEFERTPTHRRLDRKLWRTHERLTQWGEWEHRGSGGTCIGYPSQWALGRIGSAPLSAPPVGMVEPEAVTLTRERVKQLEGLGRSVVEAEYCYSYLPREARIKRAGCAGEREYKDELSRARWQMKALLRV